jgi:hypothetical protein
VFFKCLLTNLSTLGILLFELLMLLFLIFNHETQLGTHQVSCWKDFKLKYSHISRLTPWAGMGQAMPEIGLGRAGYFRNTPAVGH